MLKKDTIRLLFSKEENVLPLCIAAFFQSSCGAIWLIAIPYIIKRFGGTDTQLGLCIGLWFISYIIGCLLTGGLLDRLNSKLVVQVGAGVNVLVSVLQLTIVILGQRGICPISPVLAFIILSSFTGIFTSLFWPPLMGWISTGYEGSKLNQRLGLFNLSWSLGAISTPYFAGLLVEHNSSSPIILMLFFTFFSLVGVIFAQNPITSNLSNGQVPMLPDDVIPTLLPKFRWMSRVALFTSFVCIGLARTQLAVFFKFELPFTESDYGSAVLVMSVFTFAVFTLAGQSHAWHYKLWMFMGCQILILVSMFLILFTSSLSLLTFAVALIGIGESFMYASHLYYGVSGGTKRAGRMAIHEIILSLGFAGGGVFGGILSDRYGRYSPYWFGFSIVTIGLCIQGVIWCKKNRNQGLLD